MESDVSIVSFISIHAPARGASTSVHLLTRNFPISIHAPARGASVFIYSLLKYFNYFNSRPCERGFYLEFLDQYNDQISIHAPARGASHEYLKGTANTLFQFTPLREGLHDHNVAQMVRCIFQFTPLREGLLVKRKIFLFSILFQFTPLREGLLPFHRYVAPCTNFNSRPCERGFSICLVIRNNLPLFQFTPLREGLHCTWLFSIGQAYFNSRPCERGFVNISVS